VAFAISMSLRAAASGSANRRLATDFMVPPYLLRRPRATHVTAESFIRLPRRPGRAWWAAASPRPKHACSTGAHSR
jgi:hypothetical protein